MAVATAGSVRLHFLRPASDGGKKITYYRIHIHPTIQVIVCKSTTCSVPGLVKGNHYSFSVDAVNEIGAGPYSVASNDVTAVAPTLAPVSIVFKSNGGSGSMANEVEANGATAALSANAFTKLAYVFAGWNGKANGSGTAYVNGGTYTFDSNLTLYAQWILASTAGVISFRANGGSGTMADETDADSAPETLTFNTFAYVGHSFVDWNTAANGSGTSFNDGQKVQLLPKITLYAQWTTFVYTGTKSTSWSGYVVSGGGSKVSVASGEWRVPTLKCSDTRNSDSDVWVGTGGATLSDGSSSGPLLETGTEDNCVGGEQHDSGYFDLSSGVSEHSAVFTNFPVHAGDVILAQVAMTSANFWETRLYDYTTGLEGLFILGGYWQVDTIATLTPVGGQHNVYGASYSGGYSAEWIEEDPAGLTTGSLRTLADFGTVTFGDLGVVNAAGSWTMLNSDAIEQANSADLAAATTGPVLGSGLATSFTVTYVHLGSGQPA